MKISYDPAKRDWTLRERGLDFYDVPQLFEGLTIDSVDLRRDYGAGHRALDTSKVA
jgi:uncharacterized DUF497 family protein